MSVTAVQIPSLSTLLRLGRISNVPTVWTNALAGSVIAGGGQRPDQIALILIAMTAFYVGGMYLNDFFDRAIDARDRPGRPIHAGEIRAATVSWIGFGLLEGAREAVARRFECSAREIGAPRALEAPRDGAVHLLEHRLPDHDGRRAVVREDAARGRGPEQDHAVHTLPHCRDRDAAAPLRWRATWQVSPTLPSRKVSIG